MRAFAKQSSVKKPMDLENIHQQLASEDPQDRMRGITALRQYDATVAAPLLLEQLEAPEPMVRSFAAMGLGYKQSPVAFEQLVEVLQHDADSNVRSEAVGALAKYGPDAVPYFMTQFEQDQHWLVQMSILLAMPELEHPVELLHLIQRSRELSELTVQNTAFEQLPVLAQTPQAKDAVALLVELAQAKEWRSRRVAALGLRAFTEPAAQAALQTLKTDSDHRVVAATLEGML